MGKTQDHQIAYIKYYSFLNANHTSIKWVLNKQINNLVKRKRKMGKDSLKKKSNPKDNNIKKLFDFFGNWGNVN